MNGWLLVRPSLCCRSADGDLAASAVETRSTHVNPLVDMTVERTGHVHRAIPAAPVAHYNVAAPCQGA
jgi:hypothetical protein